MRRQWELAQAGCMRMYRSRAKNESSSLKSVGMVQNFVTPSPRAAPDGTRRFSRRSFEGLVRAVALGGRDKAACPDRTRRDSLAFVLVCTANCTHRCRGCRLATITFAARNSIQAMRSLCPSHRRMHAAQVSACPRGIRVTAAPLGHQHHRAARSTQHAVTHRKVQSRGGRRSLWRRARRRRRRC